MVTIYNIKKNVLKNNRSYILCELRGLSGDTKPTTWLNNNILNGSAFIEMDTLDIYFYDEENETWVTSSEEGE